MKVIKSVKTQSKTFGNHITTIYMLVGWAIYACLYTVLEKKASAEPIAGYLSLIGETGLDILATILTIKLYLTEIKPAKNIFLIFFLSFLAATAADSIYNLVVNLLQFQYINPAIISLFDIPFVLFLLFQMAAWGWILYTSRETTLPIRKSSYAPYAIVSILMFILFMFGIPWRIGYLSTIGIFQTIDTILEVIGFALATICLARAKSQLMRFITIGYLVVVSSDFVIRYFVISGLVPYLNPLESTWVLGMLLMCLGFIFIDAKDKNVWFKLLPVNSLQPQMAIWLLILWLLSVLMFTGLYYALAPIDEHSLSRLIKYLLATLFPLTTIATISSCYIAIKLTAPLSRLEKMVSGFMENDNIAPFNSTNTQENHIFEFVTLEKFVFDAFALFKKKLDLEIDFAKMATQISHDIKSPLVTLDIIITNFSDLPEEKRILAQRAMRRINDITNNLLTKNREIMQKKSTHYQSSTCKSDEPKSSQHLFSLIENIISEKRIQLNAKSKIDISSSVLKDGYAIFAEVQPIEFNRLLSNLINNSIEALGDSGNIQITLNILNSTVEIRIMDNGPGIHPELLLKLGQQGVSHGKFESNGLGIFHAIASCEAVNGSLNIESQIGKGTSVIITLPASKPPE
jgi:signal transduction histidine kinase